MSGARRRGMLALLGAATLMACAPLAPEPPLPERLFYQLEVTHPGTRSQGVHGRLFDAQGRSVAVTAGGAVIPEREQSVSASGKTIETNAGVFVQRAQLHLWDVSGMIQTAMLSGSTMNDPSVRGATQFRLYVGEECTGHENWRGELLNPDGRAVAEQSAPLDTPMGRFVYRRAAAASGQHGWFPEVWPPAGAGHWPCT